MIGSKRTALACALLLSASTAALADSQPPQAPPPLDVSLTPHLSDGAVDYVEVRMTIGHPDTASGATLVRMPLVVASIPTARYDGDALQASDAEGVLPLHQTDAAPTPMMTNRDWAPARATSDDVTLSFRAPMRAVNAQTRNGPLFDLRAEAGGLDGAGYTFLPIPLVKTPYRIHLHWDLSGMPAGARGVWSLGEGDVTTVRPAEILATSYYYAGLVKSSPASGSDKFALYWLSEPPFDAAAAGAMIEKLFAYDQAFFDDAGGSYRVFIRKQPYKGGGGTALHRSFMFGYGTGKVPTAENLEALIAHEMVHNWPLLDGDHSDTSWYSEGSAEYYSVLLPFRAGLISPEDFLKQINEKASGYYTNPLQRLTNQQAEAIYWQDSRAGHVPYGRGFMYLAALDAQIRAKSQDRRSLRDLELEVLKRQRGGGTVSPADWRAMVVAELGPQAGRAFDDMVAGQLIALPPNAFAPCFHPVRSAYRPFEPGFNVAALAKTKTVTGLIPGSAAAQAGLRDGDDVVEAPDFAAPDAKAGDTPVTLRVRRAGLEISLSYIPLGAPVDGWRWVRDAKIPDAACKA